MEARHLPVYLLLDCSGSMRGDKIEAVRQGVLSLISDLKNDPQARETAWLSVITFSSRAEQIIPLTELSRFQMPELTTQGGTMCGQALGLLRDCIRREVRPPSGAWEGDWAPLVFLLTDGAPSDREMYQKNAKALRSMKLANIVACAAGAQADVSCLKQLTDHVLMLNNLTVGTLAEFFDWITASVRTAARQEHRTASFSIEKRPQPSPQSVRQSSPPVRQQAPPARQASARRQASPARAPQPVRNRPAPQPVRKASPARAEKSYEELAALSSSVVMVLVMDESFEVQSNASGVAIGSRGYIVTNCHVITPGAIHAVKLEGVEKAFPAEVIKYHNALDLAVIRIDQPLQALPVYRGREALVRGQRCAAIGSPFGLMNTVSDGIISAVRQTENGELIQFTAPTSPGSSGGALLNMQGELIGITSSGVEGGENLNFAVSYRSILDFAGNFLD